MYKVGIIGAGTISGDHAVGLEGNADRAACVAVADIDQHAAEALAQQCSARAYSDHKTMLANESLDVAAVCLPHGLHLSVGLEVLEAGVHLFLEKPMALSTDACRQLMDAAQIHDRMIFVGQTHQYRENFRLAKRLIDEGRIGDVRMIYDEIWAYYGWERRKGWFLAPELAGGGPLFNTSPHQIDHLLYLVDSPITAVRASVCKLRSEADIDSDWLAFVEYENGVRGYVGTYQGTKAEDGARLQCRVFGTEGTISINAFAPEVVLAQRDSREIMDAADEVNPFVVEWRECLDALGAGRAPLTGPRYGANVVGVLEAIAESSASGCEVAPVRFSVVGDAESRVKYQVDKG